MFLGSLTRLEKKGHQGCTMWRLSKRHKVEDFNNECIQRAMVSNA